MADSLPCVMPNGKRRVNFAQRVGIDKKFRFMLYVK